MLTKNHRHGCLQKSTKTLRHFYLRQTTTQTEQVKYLIFFSQISDSVQEQFDKHWSSDNNKKRFIRTLSKILALLLNLRVYTAEKIKRIIKIAIETMLKMARTKATVRCFLASVRCVVCFSAKNNINIKNKRNITTTKNNRYKKNRQIIKIINVRRKSIWGQK